MGYIDNYLAKVKTEKEKPKDEETKETPVKKGYAESFLEEKKEKEIQATAKQYGAIQQPPSWASRQASVAARTGKQAVKGILGDIPFVRKIIPQPWQDLPPLTTTEKMGQAVPRLARDIGLFAATGGVTSALTKLPLFAKLGWMAKAGLRAKVAKGAVQGAMFGATTAGTEKPVEIAKEAGKMSAIFGAAPLAMKGLVKGTTAIAKPIGKIPVGGGKKVKDVADTIGKWMGIKLKQHSAMNLMRGRYADIKIGELDTEQFIRKVKTITTSRQRKLLPFIIEGEMPAGISRDITRQEYYKTIKPVARQIEHYLDDAHKFLVENLGNDVGFIEAYVPHIWNIPKNKSAQVINWFITKDPHTKKRFISTLKEGIEKFGLKPKYDDITDMVRVYDQMKTKTVANIRFVAGLKVIKDKQGVNYIQRIDKAPADWVTINHPVLRRAIGHTVGKDEAKILMLNKIAVKVHPEIADIVKTALDQPFHGALAQGITRINAFSKFLNLSLSLFHPNALTEAAISNSTFNPVKIIKALNKGNYGIWKDIPLTKRALAAGMSTGGIPDVQRNIIETTLKGISKKGIGKGLIPVRKFVNVWNKGLWDYYHTTLKLTAFEKLTADALKKSPSLPVKAIEREVAQFVNDTFGGQSWDLLLKTAKWQQAAHWLILAPDWTLSTVRQALSPWGIGATSAITKELRKELGQNFWTKGMLIFYGGINLLNYSLTKAEYGQGRYMWDNPPNHKTHLFLGRNSNEPEQYLRWGKQFRELPEFFIDPIKKFGGKLSPVVRQSIVQLSGYTATGWKTDIAGKPFWAKETGVARAKELGKMVAPYSLQQQAKTGFNPLAFAMPISKGMTSYGARELFKDALERGDRKKVMEVLNSAYQNNLPGIDILKQAQKTIETDVTKGDKKFALDLIKKMGKMSSKERTEYFRKKGKEGRITENVLKQIRNILKGRKKVQSEKERLNIK